MKFSRVLAVLALGFFVISHFLPAFLDSYERERVEARSARAAPPMREAQR